MEKYSGRQERVPEEKGAWPLRLTMGRWEIQIEIIIMIIMIMLIMMIIMIIIIVIASGEVEVPLHGFWFMGEHRPNCSKTNQEAKSAAATTKGDSKIQFLVSI